jgi:hypothetical protein
VDQFSIYTKQLQAMLPQWMKMAKDTESVGAQFLNVFGLEFEDVMDYLELLSQNQFIGSADLSQIDISYKVPLALPIILDTQDIDNVIAYKDGSSYRVQIVSTLQEFYSAGPDEHVAIVDRTDGIIYVRPPSSYIDANINQPYDYLTINQASHYDMILHAIWNAFDEFGLLLGIYRLYGERNGAFKNRILDIFKNPGNSTKQGLVNALSRELGVSKESVVINELSNIAFKDTLLNEDGSPTAKLVSYADKINKLLGFSWDNMSWDEAYWHSVSEANVGFDYLPHVWDVSMDGWNDDQIQSGIGDENDLLVTAPKEESNTRDYTYLVGLRGVRKSGAMVYPEHSFKYKITARGSILNQESRPESYKYTVVASEIIYVYFIVRAFQQYNYLTTIDFSSLTGYRYDTGNQLEVVEGTEILTPKAHPLLQIEAFMETSSKTETPTLDSLTVVWRDTANGLHNFIMDTQVDFDRNDSTLTTLKQNVITNVGGSVELGFGDFYHVINTEGDWNKGSLANTIITTDGSIRLVQPKI